MKRYRTLLTLTAGIALGTVLGAGLSTAYSGQTKANYDQVVAQAGETKVTRGQLAEQAISSHGSLVLENELKDRMFIEEAARRQGIAVTPEEISQRVKEYLTLVEQFDKLSSILGTPEMVKSIPTYILEDEARIGLLAEKVMKVQINEDNINTWYVENLRKFYRPKMAKLVVVVTNSYADAKGALNALKKCKPGDAINTAQNVSAEYSNDPIIKGERGNIGWYSAENAMVPEFADAIFKKNGGLKPGESTDILRYAPDPQKPNAFEYRIFYVEDLLPAWMPTQAEVRPACAFLARMEKIKEAQGAWIKKQDITWKRLRNLTKLDDTDLVEIPKR